MQKLTFNFNSMFILMSLTKKERKYYEGLLQKNRLNELPDFQLEDVSTPVSNNLIRVLFLQHFDIKFLNGRWITYGQGAAERIEPIKYYYHSCCYPTAEMMVKYANLQLKRLKEKHALQASGASSCSVCTPVAATSTGEASLATEEFDVESMDLILKNAERLSEEIRALTAEIKKGLEPNSSF